uniref:Carbohydrate kinase PfkB domain-containing protein n=1 Tax=Kalanchoe fedtschenkoi TaxID=63787 RepID=A0A7N0U381_KALFE
MHIHGAVLKPPEPAPAPCHGTFRHSYLIPAASCKLASVVFTTARSRGPLVLSCKGIQVSDAKQQSSSSIGSLSNGVAKSVGVKEVDVATLGNLCVDIVLSVPHLPPASLDERKKYMEQFSASPPDKKNWEAGGNCNMAIAASRLGLSCVTIGHVGKEIYGNFLVDVLQNENIGMVQMDKDDNDMNNVSCETLLCWVLVDHSQRHGFCSRADFCQEPAFNWMSGLSHEVEIAIKHSKILFCNGYGFDDFSPSLLTSALNYAVEVGTAIFFDPGPRGRSLSVGSPDEQSALDLFLRMSDVLLLTSDEAQSLTGIRDPIRAGKKLLRNVYHVRLHLR